MATILLVDDSLIIQRTLSLVLRKMGHQASAFATAEEALAAVRERPFDVAIVDLNLPKMSGLELATALRSEPKTASLPIAMLTASTDGDDQKKAEEIGIERFLNKPVRSIELKDIIHQLVTS